jgi:hypothetical protein
MLRGCIIQNLYKNTVHMQTGNYTLQVIFRCRKILTQIDFVAVIFMPLSLQCLSLCIENKHIIAVRDEMPCFMSKRVRKDWI